MYIHIALLLAASREWLEPIRAIESGIGTLIAIAINTNSYNSSYY